MILPNFIVNLTRPVIRPVSRLLIRVTQSKSKTIIISYGKLVTYMNDGTSRQSVRQIR